MYSFFCKACRLLFLVAGLLIYSLSTYSQANPFGNRDLSEVNVDAFNDGQINKIIQNAESSGYSIEEILKFAEESGMQPLEITKLRLRLGKIINGRKESEKGVYEFENSRDNESRYDTSGQTVPVQKFDYDHSIFGSELFSSTSLVFEPNLRIPAPPNYMLGPDDEILVSVFGYSEKRYKLTVNELGEIYIPNVGPISVSGLTLEQATARIRDKLAHTIYRAINTGQTKVQVTLGKIRSIRVTVIGQARKPGTYTVSSLTTLYNLLYLCGGPTDMGSYRDIEVIRGKEKRTADLYDFLVDGNQKGNILLQEGDVVRIPYYKNRVILSGNVKRQGKYEMLDSETFDNLLKYSGGFTDIAYRGGVTVKRIADSERVIIDVPSSRFNSFIVKGSDQYVVGRMQDEYGNRIYVGGAVQRPGPYQLSEGLTVKELLEKAGGLTPEAYTHRAIVYRYFQNKMPAIISVSLDSILNFGQTVYLQKNDSLVVPSIFEFEDENTISVEGYVRKPGAIQWRDNLTLGDVLLAVGGITETGDSSTLEISRRIKNANIGKLNHTESEVFNVNLNAEGSTNTLLQPFDLIIVKSKPGYTIQRSVMVQGEVKSPGKYALEKSASTIADVMSRTGGFKPAADSSSLTIRRISKSTFTPEERSKIFQRVLNIDKDSLANNPSLRNELYKSYELISVNLKEALDHPENSNNLRLEDGDILSIERNTNLVKVSGEVYFPTVVPYREGKNLKYYVQQAGNFMPQARKSGALVIQPDGKVASVKHFLFFKSYPSVSPRSEIFVPQKERINRTRISTGEWALIVSALAIVGNVIINSIK